MRDLESLSHLLKIAWQLKYSIAVIQNKYIENQSGDFYKDLELKQNVQTKVWVTLRFNVTCFSKHAINKSKTTFFYIISFSMQNKYLGTLVLLALEHLLLTVFLTSQTASSSRNSWHGHYHQTFISRSANRKFKLKIRILLVKSIKATPLRA